MGSEDRSPCNLPQVSFPLLASGTFQGRERERVTCKNPFLFFLEPWSQGPKPKNFSYQPAPYPATNPDLSRRVGRIMGLLAMAIPWEERSAFIARIERARGSEELPEDDRQAILEAEKAAAWPPVS